MPPTEAGEAKGERTSLGRQHERSIRLSDWHKELKRRHQTRAKRLKEKLAKMSTERSPQHAPRPDVRGQEVTENTPVEEIELTEEEKAESAASAEVFAEHLELGDGADPELQSVNETLMPSGAVVADGPPNEVLDPTLVQEVFGVAVLEARTATGNRHLALGLSD